MTIWGLIGIAAGAGAFGGLISALLPGDTTSTWWKSVLIGAGAAVAIMLVLPPTQDMVQVVSGESETTTTYSLINLIATAIIAGSAGPRVFAALQTRTLAAAADQQKQTTAAVSQAAVKKLREQIPTLVEEQVAKTADATVASQAAESVSSALGPHISAAQDMIAAASGEAAPPSAPEEVVP